MGFAIWRETLIDAAIFREAITDNSARTMPARMSHLFCERFYRARASGLAEGSTFAAPISPVRETLGMSIATVNRTLEKLRASRAVDFSKGRTCRQKLETSGRDKSVQTRLRPLNGCIRPVTEDSTTRRLRQGMGSILEVMETPLPAIHHDL
jgi:hypothetical protein